ncbi:MAG: efflux RND transporter permease subunit [Candidatus Krumholzibacteriota bacterium]|nr:efflux RND transporter permease subunit [Candidatus Krumholzibacteriota bacterium]
MNRPAAPAARRQPMSIIEGAIRRRTLVAMIFTGAVLLGVVSWRQLPVELIPSMELPMLVVSVSSRASADPETIERQAVLAVEGAIGTLEGIESIETRIRQRSAGIMISYLQGTDMKYAYLRLEEKVNLVRASLPDGYDVAVSAPLDFSMADEQLMTLQALGEGGVDRVRSVVEQRVVSRIEGVDGVAAVGVAGGSEEAVEILLDETACLAVGVTAADVAAIVNGGGPSDAFVGLAVDGAERWFVTVSSSYEDVRDIEDLVVRGEGDVRLGDIAEIRLGAKEETSISRVNGKDAVTITVTRESQVNIIDLSGRVQKTIGEINRDLASLGVELAVETDAAEAMRENVDLVVQLAVVGGLFAVLVLWMFLGNVRLVATIALAIPVSILAAFNFFYAADISINLFTLVGLALVVGMLLDNSIVVLENIYRHLSFNRGDVTAAVAGGTGEVWRSILAATLTTVTVFLTFVFSERMEIRLLGTHLSVSVVSTLLVSLVVALLLVPVVTHGFLSRRGGVDHARFRIVTRRNRLMQAYTTLLKTALRHPARTIVLAVVAFFFSLALAIGMTAASAPEEEPNQIDVYVTMPEGTTLEATDAAIADVEQRLSDLPEREQLLTRVEAGSAMLQIDLKEGYWEERRYTYAAVKEDVKSRTDELRGGDVSIGENPSATGYHVVGGGGGGAGGAGGLLGGAATTEEIHVEGDDFGVLMNVAEDLVSYLEDLSTVSSASHDASENSPELHLFFDDAVAGDRNVALSGIRRELAAFTDEYGASAVLHRAGERIPIVIRTDEVAAEGGSAGKTIDELRSLSVATSDGGTVELGQIARFVYAFGTPRINRFNQEKRVTVRYDFASEVMQSRSLLGAARGEVDELVAGLRLPDGVALDIVHGDPEYREFLFLIFVAFILIYMILAAVFESLTAPLVILFTIPLAGVGAFVLLILTGTPLVSMYTMTGLLILLGVVVNNGIILIDYTRILRGRGYRRARALMTAGQARLRPIMITAVTTIVGMIPLAMGKIEQATILGAPFAITIIGGLAFGTVFTLVLIPVAYSGLENTLEWMHRRDRRLVLLQAVLFAGGVWLAWARIDSLLWRIAAIFSLLFLVPGCTWFVLASLRRARAELVPAEDEVVVSVRNLAKDYERPTRFVREWRKGARIAGENGGGTSTSRIPGGLRWEAPLLAFAAYFVYVYLVSGFWIFLLSHAVWALAWRAWRSIETGLAARSASGERIDRLFRELLLWAFPAANLVFFWTRWESRAAVVFAAVLWFGALGVYALAGRVRSGRVDFDLIVGRFAGIRLAVYRAVWALPLLGRPRRPFRALGGVSMEIGRGMFGLLGPNGAGKTTLMRVVCGILEQSYGKVFINGIDTAERREELQGLIGYLPQEFGTYENMTAREFLDYQAILRGLVDRDARDARVDYVLGAVHMDEHANRRIGAFSGGMKQRIGIAQTLLHLPRILVVDEPTAGLDPRERIRFRNLLVELSRERVVIFSTHIIEDISSSCSLVAVLSEGLLRYLGEPARMTERAEGRVWMVTVPPAEFEALLARHRVVHHMRDGAMVRARVLAGEKPHAAAERARPSLEDAYIWLLRGSGAEGSLPHAGR